MLLQRIDLKNVPVNLNTTFADIGNTIIAKEEQGLV